ncbi:MAG TPA: hypothetical protein VEW68_04060, partial [Patescibacteria group bacterium]|nr:hypothetical protein [Patescibacteria group bacterium]
AAVALFGVGLAVEARLRRWPALVGIVLALSLWRPANCLPVIAIFLVAGWSRRDLLVAVGSGALLMLPLTLIAFAISPEWISTYRQELAAILGWSGLGPHLLHGFGPVAYGAAQAAVAVAGWWVLRRRNLRDAAAFTLALSVLLATVAGAYSGSLALPAVIVAATSDLRYRALPLVSNVFGWAITTALLTSGFAVGVVAYWYMIQAYPLLRRLPIAGEDRVLARPVPE